MRYQSGQLPLVTLTVSLEDRGLWRHGQQNMLSAIIEEPHAQVVGWNALRAHPIVEELGPLDRLHADRGACGNNNAKFQIRRAFRVGIDMTVMRQEGRLIGRISAEVHDNPEAIELSIKRVESTVRCAE